MKTPGSWHVRKVYASRSIVPSYWVAPEGPEPGTEALAKLMRGNRNRVDDARLMAAAPDLLEALRETTLILKRCVEDDGAHESVYEQLEENEHLITKIDGGAK